MRRPVVLSHIGAALAITLLTAGCESPSGVALEEGAAFSSVHATTAQDELLRSVRQATSRFNSTTQAVRAGYLADYDHCVAVPGLGGMGYHWANPGLVDGVFDLRQPELMLYAPGPDGNLRLVAVEYLVVAGEGQDLEADRPYFGSHPFDIGGTPFPAPHWSLHVWLYENNPSGIFTPFNPNVSCPSSGSHH